MDSRVEQIPLRKSGEGAPKNQRAVLSYSEREYLRKQLKNHLAEQKEYMSKMEPEMTEYAGNLENLGFEALAKEKKSGFEIEKTKTGTTIFVKDPKNIGKKGPTDSKEIFKIDPKVENTLSKQLRESGKGDKPVNAFWRKIDENISDWFKWMDGPAKQKESWRNIKTIKPLEGLSTQKIKMKDEFVDYGRLINAGRYEELPEVLQKYVKSVQNKYPDTRIMVGSAPRDSKTPDKYFDMHKTLRKFTAGPQNKADLKKLGIEYDSLKPPEQAAIRRWSETGKKEFLPDWISEKIEESWIRSRQTWSDKELANVAGMQIKTSRDLGEQEFNTLTWAMEPLMLEGLTEKEAQKAANNISYLFTQEIKNSIYKKKGKWYSGKTPLYSALLGTMGALGLQSKKEE